MAARSVSVTCALAFYVQTFGSILKICLTLDFLASV